MVDEITLDNRVASLERTVATFENIANAVKDLTVKVDSIIDDIAGAGESISSDINIDAVIASIHERLVPVEAAVAHIISAIGGQLGSEHKYDAPVVKTDLNGVPSVNG